MIVYLIIFLLMFAIYNAYMVLEITTNNKNTKMYSNRWHVIGLLMRIMVWIIPILAILFKSSIAIVLSSPLTLITKWTIEFVLAGGLMYDVIINAIRYYHEGKPKLTYVDYKHWNKWFVDSILIVVRKTIKKDYDIESAKMLYFWLRIVVTIVIFIVLLF